MFPKIFETSVYTVQPTVCPTDMISPPGHQHPLPVPDSSDSRSPPEGSSLSSNLPVQEGSSETSNLNGQPHLGEDVSIVKNYSQFPSKGNLTQDERLAVARRRKTEASIFCTFPDCSADFTTKHRLATHIKSCHLGIKDEICGTCSYATAHPSDLVRHKSKLGHT